MRPETYRKHRTQPVDSLDFGKCLLVVGIVVLLLMCLGYRTKGDTSHTYYDTYQATQTEYGGP